MKAQAYFARIVSLTLSESITHARTLQLRELLSFQKI
jgi:hypothetical protein